MFRKSSAILLVAAFLEALPASVGGFYTKNSPVLQVDESNYDNLIAKSNHASLVSYYVYTYSRFYAPWCGHCQNLKPAYEKAAKSLQGLAKVAAVNCDDDSNKPFCGRMGVKGFPTLKVITPSKNPGKPLVEDYQGARTAKAIVDFVVDRIPNHVRRIKDKELDSWLKEANDTAKAILFTEKGTTSALLRSLAIDYHGSISLAQIRSKETAAVEMFGITKFPSLVLLPGGSKEAIIYDGEMKKNPMFEFFNQVAEPNPEPVQAKSKQTTKTGKATTSTSTSSDSDATTSSTATESPESSSKDPSSTSPKPRPIPSIFSDSMLRESCLAPKTGTCVLALVGVPEDLSTDSVPSATVLQALGSLAEISQKHSLRKSHLFPFYTVPSSLKDVDMLKTKLDLTRDIDIDVIAVNVKRGWWRRYDAGDDGDWSVAKLEAWIDAIRMGEGTKRKLPEGIVPDEEEKKGPEEGAEKEQKKESGEEPEQKPVKEKYTGHSEL
ncbi:thioredoxin [Histoplasma capsulatum var. duboisii H88]|uniref:protein disulfide-isomerase n=2 Tax=Ajellomyces capsulatus TaxID=5037 RepID=F0ULG1_AJEC8|nr:thioredoxin [Histoplasma capsulatum H143]EGC46231.1 thioredoxin [Histoplasma capsulatum var. duboisii H88]